MSTREDAQELLSNLYSCIPRSFYSNLESTQRGFGFVLSYLEQSDGEVVSGDLSKRLNVSTARIAALLKRMEQSGLITRQSSSEDARRTVVKITPKGVALIDEMRERTLVKIELLLEQISKEELDTYIRISHQIKEVMDE